jgi:hydrogenase maturation protease
MIRPVLVIGLGNAFMGDDGIGCCVAEALAADPRLPAWAEVIVGGTDLLRLTTRMEGRSRIVILDAALDERAPGTVIAMDERAAAGQGHAHHLSAGQAVGLLRLTIPAEFELLGISVNSADAGSGLSPALADRVPFILETVLQALSTGSHPPESG